MDENENVTNPENETLNEESKITPIEEKQEEPVQEPTITENVETTNTTSATTKKKSKSGFIILIALIAVIALLLIFGKYNQNSIKKLAGTYEIVEMVEEGEDITESLEMLKALGMEIKLELREDGTGTINLMGEKSELTFNSFLMTMEGNPQTYSVDKDGRISMESSDGTKMVFARVEENKVEEKTNTIVDSIEENEDTGIIGKYKIVEIRDSEGDMTSELEKMEELGLTIIMELKEGGTGTMNAFGDNMEFTYDDKYFIIDSDKSEYSVDSEGRITIQDSEENGGTTMVFEKTTDDIETKDLNSVLENIVNE